MAHSWASPSFRPERIEKLISDVDRYNSQNRSVLLEYLDEQLKNGTYDALANFAILKLFQLNPTEFGYDAMVNILIKTLTAAPFPDFSLCISLLGEAPIAKTSQSNAGSIDSATGIISEPIVVRLAKLSTALSETRFREFWALYKLPEYEDIRKYTANIAGFEAALRQVVLNSVKGTFRTISETRLSGYLDLQDASFAEYISKQPGWMLSNGLVTVPLNIDNEVKPTVVREEITQENLSKLLAQA
ncbi:hypothetical protein MVES1_000595 [Malassezia vespertilionis]|nr:uncharacterized protein MVES1_000595 [Malassezia vespertilionis]WFD05266.1 hypothetical protein MVES1_000595 [Malassezia vespertilionis]